MVQPSFSCTSHTFMRWYISSCSPQPFSAASTCSVVVPGRKPKRDFTSSSFRLYGGTPSSGGKKYASSLPGPTMRPLTTLPECTWQGIGGTSAGGFPSVLNCG